MKPLYTACFATGLSLFAFVTGCSNSGQSSLQIESARSGDLYRHALPVGVADVQDNGETDLVFTCQTDGVSAGCPPVKHVLHVRVLWQQGHQIKAQDLHSSQNAAIHWYVSPVGRTDADRPAQGLIEYRGTGLARVTRTGDQVLVTLADASLSPAHVSGATMVDRLGQTTLRGTLVARQSRQETAVALGDMRATLAASRVDAAEASLQP